MSTYAALSSAIRARTGQLMMGYARRFTEEKSGWAELRYYSARQSGDARRPSFHAKFFPATKTAARSFQSPAQKIAPFFLICSRSIVSHARRDDVTSSRSFTAFPSIYL